MREEKYAYPADLARLVCERWGEHPPDLATLTRFLSACYQASLLREEERPVTFRAVLADPAIFPAAGLPPEYLQPLAFTRAFPFDAHELRRLSVATDTRRTLIGVRQEGDGTLRIWGLVNSGTRWLRDVHGGRRAGTPLPPAPAVHVTAPGSMAVSRGDELIATLERGHLAWSRANPFESAWLPDEFTDFRDGVLARHAAAAARALSENGETWARLEKDLPRQIAGRMMLRVIALLREARHGGTIVFLPAEAVASVDADDRYIDLKYRFRDQPPAFAFGDLVASILNRLAQLHAGDSDTPEVGWPEFEAATDNEIASLDETLFETAYVIAELASADGAVVLSKDNDVLGFGGMISGRLPAVRTVSRAVDLEGERVEEEGVDNVGARHRSAYRLAGALAGAVVVVVSQDGGVRFVSQRNGRVTYWEQE